MYTAKCPLLDEHAKVIHDVTPVKHILDSITRTVRTLLKKTPFWVLIEEQFTQFREEPEKDRFKMVFTLQLESCISMYFVQQGIEVRTIHSTKRFPFLGYAGWKSDTRWDRKQRVAAEVSSLLDPSVPGNEFARREHDLTNWESLTQRHDVADAISQCHAAVGGPKQARHGECQEQEVQQGFQAVSLLKPPVLLLRPMSWAFMLQALQHEA
jgi:hypothetical protein